MSGPQVSLTIHRIRHSLIKTILAATIAVVLPQLCPGADAKTYRIRFNFKDKVGAQYRVAAAGKDAQEMLLKRGTGVLRREQRTSHWNVDAGILVTSISHRQLADGLTISLRKLVLNDGVSDSRSLVESGTQITGSVRNGKEVFTINGQAVSQDLNRILTQVINLDDGNPSYDQLFGTTSPQPVGGRWPINRQAMVENAKRNNATVQPEAVTGQGTLKGLIKVAGKQCLETHVNAEISSFESGRIPQGYTSKESGMSVRYEVTTPVDQTTPMLTERQELTMKTTLESTQQNALIVETSAQITVDKTYKYHAP